MAGKTLTQGRAAIWVPAAGQLYYVNTASTAGGNGTTNATSGASRAWATLWEGIQALNGTTLTQPTTIYCSGSAADTQGIGSVDVITSATNYLSITTSPDSRHGSIWDASKYRLEVTNAFVFRNNTTSYLRVDGLQLKLIQTTGTYYGMKLLGANNTGPFDIRYSNNLVVGVTNGSCIGITCDNPNSGTGRCRSWNNVVYGFFTGFGGLAVPAGANHSAYNNTAYGNTYNFVCDGEWEIINCLSASPGISDYVSAFAASSDYNAADGAGAPGTHSRSNQTFSFVDAVNHDLRLAADDEGARGFGLSDPASGLFADDFMGLARVGAWDIGAAKGA